MSTYTYKSYAVRIENDRRMYEGYVDVIRNTVRARAPGILLAEIAALPRPPVDRGGYRRSWKVMNIAGGARVYSISPYAIMIEKGRRPGARMPPIALIAAWLIRKGLVTLPGKGRGKRRAISPSQLRDAGKEVTRVAFMIARSIARRGIPARWVMRNAGRKIDAAVTEALGRNAQSVPGV